MKTLRRKLAERKYKNAPLNKHSIGWGEEIDYQGENGCAVSVLIILGFIIGWIL